MQLSLEEKGNSEDGEHVVPYSWTPGGKSRVYLVVLGIFELRHDFVAPILDYTPTDQHTGDLAVHPNVPDLQGVVISQCVPWRIDIIRGEQNSSVERRADHREQ